MRPPTLTTDAQEAPTRRPSGGLGRSSYLILTFGTLRLGRIVGTMECIMIAAEIRLPRPAALRLAGFFGSAFAVALCCLSLLIFKTISVFGAASEKVLTFLRCGGLVRTMPRLAAFVGMALGLFSAMPATAQILPWFGGWFVRDSIFVIGLVLLVNGAPHALAAASVVKMSSEEISDPIEAWFAGRLAHVADAVWPSVLLLMSLLILPAAIAMVTSECLWCEDSDRLCGSPMGDLEACH